MPTLAHQSDPCRTVPPRPSAIPWERLWWLTQDQYMARHRAARAQSSRSALRDDACRPAYVALLRELERRARRDGAWYHGALGAAPALPLRTSMLPIAVAASCVAVAGSPAFARLLRPHGAWHALGLGGLSHIPMSGAILALGIAGLAWASFAYHVVTPWVFAGWPWWPPARRVTRMLRRVRRATISASGVSRRHKDGPPRAPQRPGAPSRERRKP